MPDYRRHRVPGGTYFFTINLLERRSDLLVRHVAALREAVRRTRSERPFHIDAWVVLPDHMHCVITLPTGDDDFSNRIKAIKIRFVRAVAPKEWRSTVRIAKGERGIWQRRFWEHANRNDEDYAPRNTGMSQGWRIGLIRRFIVGRPRVRIPPTGEVVTLRIG